jgi:hypothetical protein
MAMLQKILGFTMAAAAGSYRRKFEEDTLQAAEVNKSVLKEILKLNSDSEYGCKYQFSSIISSS